MTTPSTAGTGADPVVQALIQDVTRIKDILEGDQANGVPSYNDLLLMNTQVQQQMQTLTNRVNNVESTIDPVLQRADVEIQKIKDQAEDIKQVIQLEAQAQEQKQSAVLQQTREKFQEHEDKQKEVLQHAANKFQELESLRMQFEVQTVQKVSELDQKVAEVSRVYNLLVNMGQADVVAARAKLSEALGPQGTFGNSALRKTKEISEYKAVQTLATFNGDNRIGYKQWLYKLKNCLDQVRGKEWRKILDALENHRVATDFEELVTQDDKWDEWFENQFGSNRTDGGEPVDIEQFKGELMWILTDKLNEPHRIGTKT